MKKLFTMILCISSYCFASSVGHSRLNSGDLNKEIPQIDDEEWVLVPANGNSSAILESKLDQLMNLVKNTPKELPTTNKLDQLEVTLPITTVSEFVFVQEHTTTFQDKEKDCLRKACESIQLFFVSIRNCFIVSAHKEE